MFILRTNISQEWNVERCTSLIRAFAKQYLKSQFNRGNKRDINRTLERLQNLTSNLTECQELHISNLTYNKNLRILLSSIINSIELRNDGVYLRNNNSSFDRSLIKLYKAITYGNLESRPCSILKDAIEYGTERMVLQLTYGN